MVYLASGLTEGGKIQEGVKPHLLVLSVCESCQLVPVISALKGGEDKRWYVRGQPGLW